MENLISLIIELLSGLFGEGKKEQRNDSPPSPSDRPDPSRPKPIGRSTSWEDELRRLLDNQNPSAITPPPPRPVSPSPMTPPTPRIVTLTPPPATLRPPPPFRPASLATPPPLPARVIVTSQQLGSLIQAQPAYTRAGQLDTGAVARTPGQHLELTTVVRRAVSPELLQTVSLFKNARAARQAVLISAIFGPPRAFEEQTSPNFLD